MANVTPHEIEMLGGLIATRMVVSEIEIIWVNNILTRLQVQALEDAAPKKPRQKPDLKVVPERPETGAAGNEQKSPQTPDGS